MLGRVVIILTLVFYSLGAYAQKDLIRSGKYIYYAPDNISIDKAKSIALERARIQIIADEFGTLIQQRNITEVKNSNGNSSVDFTSLSESEVGGEWIEDVKNPKYTIAYENNMLIVEVEVCGRIRQITTARTNFTAKILRNGTEEKYEDYEFFHDDDLFLLFSAPIGGYLSVYLDDGTGNVFFLAPYATIDSDDRVAVKARVEYIFYSQDHAPHMIPRHLVRCYTMQCLDVVEHNSIYIVFSPNIYANADYIEMEGGMHVLKYDDFKTWLARCRRQDPEMQIKKYDIIINPLQ